VCGNRGAAAPRLRCREVDTQHTRVQAWLGARLSAAVSCFYSRLLTLLWLSTPQAEVRALEAKYEAQYAPLYSKRSGLVTGATDCEQPADDTSEAPAGVPDFWLVALSNHEALAESIQEKDAAVLSHLKDVSCSPVTGTDKDGDPMYGFELKFEFAEGNPFMSNSVLTKTYLFSDEDQSYLVASKGTDIAWTAGKDPTVKVFKKKGTKPGAKPQTKIERVDSFFNFFSPPEVPEEDDEMEEEELEALQEALEADHELGSILKDEIIPNAVSWFTGAAMQQEEDEEEDEEGDDDEDGDEDEEEEEEVAPKGGKKGGKGRGAPRGGAGGDKPEECKQQ
jgi:nucleosome assembly protein 1-like 1